MNIDITKCDTGWVIFIGNLWKPRKKVKRALASDSLPEYYPLEALVDDDSPLDHEENAKIAKGLDKETVEGMKRLMNIPYGMTPYARRQTADIVAKWEAEQ